MTSPCLGRGPRRRRGGGHLPLHAGAGALEDGELVDVSATAREAGIRFPVAVSLAAWDEYVELTPAAERAGNDKRGELGTWCECSS
jgi:hypothetical protein